MVLVVAAVAFALLLGLGFASSLWPPSVVRQIVPVPNNNVVVPSSLLQVVIRGFPSPARCLLTVRGRQPVYTCPHTLLLQK